MDAGTLWTGTFTFALVDVNARPAWSLVIVLSRDLATFWYADRNLAMIDRDELRTWTAGGTEPLERHDVTLTCVRDWISVSVGEGPPMWLAAHDTTRLRVVL